MQLKYVCYVLDLENLRSVFRILKMENLLIYSELSCTCTHNVFETNRDDKKVTTLVTKSDIYSEVTGIETQN